MVSIESAAAVVVGAVVVQALGAAGGVQGCGSLHALTG